MLPADEEAFDRLPPSERVRLVVDLWERLARHPNDIPVTPGQLDELERRLDDDDAHPESAVPLEVARRRLRSA